MSTIDSSYKVQITRAFEVPLLLAWEVVDYTIELSMIYKI